MAKSIYDVDDDSELLNNDEGLLSVDSEDVPDKDEDYEQDEKEEEKDEEEIKPKSKSKGKKETLLSVDDEDIQDDEEQKEDKRSKKDSKGKTVQQNVDYDGLVKTLKDEGVFESDIPEDFTGTKEEFRSLIENETDFKLNDMLTKIDSKYNGALSFMINGGDIKEFAKVVNENMYDTIKLEDIEDNVQLQEKAFRDYYKSKGLSDKLIEKKLQNAKDYETLKEEVVEEYLPELKEQSKKQKEEIKVKQARKVEEVELKTKQLKEGISKYVNEAESFIPTNKLKKSDKDKIIALANSDELFKDLDKDPIKSRVTLAALKYYGVLEGKWDKILNDISSKENLKVKQSFITSSKNKGADSTMFNDSDDNDTGNKILQAFEKTFGKKK